MSSPSKSSTLVRANLSYRQIRIIDAIAQHRSIGQAADALHMSQPAVTRALQNAEDMFGVRLFDRTPNGVVPTVFAEPILKRAKSIGAAIQETERDLERLRHADEMRLSIGGGPYSIEIFGYPAATYLSLSDAQADISITTLALDDLADQLRSGTIDIGISEAGLIEVHPDLRVEVVASLPVCFACRPDHPLMKIKSPKLDDVNQFPLIGNKISPQIAKHFGAQVGAFGQIHKETGALVPAIRVMSPGAIKHGVAISNAVALMPRAFIADDIAAGRLTNLDPSIAPDLVARMGIVTTRTRTMTPLMTEFRKAVLTVAAQSL